jgi:hypothetical protein
MSLLLVFGFSFSFFFFFFQRPFIACVVMSGSVAPALTGSGAAAAAKKMEAPHQLSLKVMRLAKPAFVTGLALGDGVDEDALFLDSSSLKLAAAFGEIYLGETFSCYLTVQNTTTETVTSVAIKAELQTTSKRYMLQNLETAPIASLMPEQSEDSVLHRVICDEGVHILVCTASYLTLTMGRRSFRKFFKFNVTQPFSLSHRQVQCPAPPSTAVIEGAKWQQQHPGDVAVETELENNTPSVLCVTNVRLVCNEQLFSVASADSRPVNGITYVPPSCCVQFVHRLVPLRSEESGAFPAAGAAMGYLELSWARGWGETGTILSPPLVYTPLPKHAVEAEVEVVGTLVAGQARAVKCKITNMHHYDVQRVRVHLVNEAGAAVVLTGLSGIELPPLPPRQSVSVDVTMLPLRPGMQQLGKVMLETEHEKFTCNLGMVVIE